MFQNTNLKSDKTYQKLTFPWSKLAYITILNFSQNILLKTIKTILKIKRVFTKNSNDYWNRYWTQIIFVGTLVVDSDSEEEVPINVAEAPAKAIKKKVKPPQCV